MQQVEVDNLYFADYEEMSPTQVCSAAPSDCAAICPFRTQTLSEMTPASASLDDDEFNDRYGSLAAIIAVLEDQYASDASSSGSGGVMDPDHGDVPLDERMLALPVGPTMSISPGTPALPGTPILGTDTERDDVPAAEHPRLEAAPVAQAVPSASCTPAVLAPPSPSVESQGADEERNEAPYSKRLDKSPVAHDVPSPVCALAMPAPPSPSGASSGTESNADNAPHNDPSICTLITASWAIFKR